MPRPPRFDDAAILRAALSVAHERGPAALTTDAVAQAMGGHVGSIYYRFPTKDHLLARLWLHCARAGQAGAIEAMSDDDLESAFERSALHYPRWARAEVATAQVLAAYGREQLVPTVPDDLAAEFDEVNNPLNEAVLDFARRWYAGSTVSPANARRAVTFALLDLPASAIRRYLLAGRRPPESLDSVVLAASRAALDAARP